MRSLMAVAVTGVAAAVVAACGNEPVVTQPKDPPLSWMQDGAGAETVARERKLDVQCPGLEGFTLQLVHGVDAGGGTIRSKATGRSIGISVGSVAESAPRRRPAGYRWYKSERIGEADVTYGLAISQDIRVNGQAMKRNVLQVTLVGAPMSQVVNLVADPTDEAMVLAVARTLATAQCTWTESGR